VAAGCGGSSDGPTLADLPPEWEAVTSRLDAEGLESEAVGVGVVQRPGLLVHSEPPVVLVPLARGRGDNFSPSPTPDPDGGTVEINLSISCSNAVAFSASGASRTIREVFAITELCPT
jgi:hypothetical protein